MVKPTSIFRKSIQQSRFRPSRVDCFPKAIVLCFTFVPMIANPVLLRRLDVSIAKLIRDFHRQIQGTNEFPNLEVEPSFKIGRGYTPVPKLLFYNRYEGGTSGSFHQVAKPTSSFRRSVHQSRF